MKKTKFLVAIFFLAILVTNAQVPANPQDVSPLLIGETLPKATLQDLDGANVSLQEILAKKPTVLVFYRGGWCPYCNRQLSGLATAEAKILELGYQIVAISPDNYKRIQLTVEEDKVNYKVFSDVGAKLIQDVGIGFLTPESAKPYIERKTALEASNVLPVPSVFVVDKSGEILFEYINIDYKHRLTDTILLAILKDLK